MHRNLCLQWYCERAEWFHPMFIRKQYEVASSKMEVWAKYGVSYQLMKKLADGIKDLSDTRQGGCECTYCY